MAVAVQSNLGRSGFLQLPLDAFEQMFTDRGLGVMLMNRHLNIRGCKQYYISILLLLLIILSACTKYRQLSNDPDLLLFGLINKT